MSFWSLLILPVAISLPGSQASSWAMMAPPSVLHHQALRGPLKSSAAMLVMGRNAVTARKTMHATFERYRARLDIR
ncbi:hypothetical protein D0B54_11755 [Solimonas sp. K1W22B-7]|nr:hypothetical protein D0B54_11755 [Solimonas sp. K1W22B-7]